MLRKVIGKEVSLALAIAVNVFIVVVRLPLLLLLVVYFFQLLPVLFIVQSIDVAYGVTGKRFFRRRMPATDPKAC
jgi:hypothetical protein